MLFLAALLSVALSEVVSLTADDFKDKVENNNVLVKFFAPWCGHCRALAPAYLELSEKYDKAIIAEVDCTVQTDLCREQNVRGYPTIKFFHESAEGVAYSGARTADAMAEWVDSQL